MKTRLILLLCLTTLAAQAQVPGFLGKRFAVFVEGNPTPAVFVQNINNKAIIPGEFTSKSRFAFNFRPQATLDYLAFRKISIGLSYSRVMVGTVRKYTLEPDGDYQADRHPNLDVVKGNAFGLHAKFFLFGKSSTIPPIGFYQTASLYYTKVNTYDDKKATAKQFEKDFAYPVIGFSTGRQSMIAKNLLLKTGVEYGWTFGPKNFLSGLDDYDLDQYAAHQAVGSLFAYFMFSFNVGLGYTF